ncbi:MAG TPA: Smr/MutS family protein [Burkholderiales bacterium]|nr:Smr/MutS family protein [Burkholderiales bacterium]
MADADDREALRRALAGVKPLAAPRRHAPRRPAPPPVPAQTRRDERAVLAESLSGPLTADEALESGVELSYLRDGMSRQALRRLRRGHWVVQDHLDLHGMNRDEAALQVAAFVRAAAARGLRCVRIVHGKGLGSKNREPVLKGKLRAWLMPRDEVLAYCQAPAAEGGSGALLVLLKAR